MRRELGQLTKRELLELLIAQEESNASPASSIPYVGAHYERDIATQYGRAATPLPSRLRLQTDTIRGSSGAAGLVAERDSAHLEVPTLDVLYTELERELTRSRFARALRSTLAILVTVAAAAVLVATLATPVLQITGSSMTPTLHDGQLVVSIKGGVFEPGDVIAFYYNNKILVKRVIAGPGDWVDIDKYGNVFVNDQALDEPYLTDKALGECDINLPYQVPDGRYFVMGDHRATSVDSRSSTIGCVAEEQVVGNISFRIWPLTELGPVS